MSKCKLFITLITVVVLVSSMAHGALTSFTADAPHVFTPIGAIILLDVASYTPSSITITAEADAPFSISLTAINSTGSAWAACTLVSDTAAIATFVPGSGQSTDFQNVTDVDATTMLFQTPYEVASGEFVTLEYRMQIPATGPLTFTQILTPTQIPEPVTVALLGLGTLALVVRRRHA